MAKAVRIPPIPGFSWKGRIGILTSVFGGLWLFLKPLDTFGVATGLFDSLGLLGYLALLAISIGSTITTEIIHLRTQAGTIDWITFVTISRTHGIRHLVQAPADIQCASFISAFWDYILQTPSGTGWRVLREKCDWRLMLHRDSEEVEILPEQTLRQGGVHEGSECALEGTLDGDIAFLVADV